MKKMRRIITVLLSMAMLFSLVGCGKESSSGDDEPKKDYVYTTEYQTIQNSDYLGNAAYLNNKLYYSTYVYDESTEMGGYQVHVLDMATMEDVDMGVAVTENENISNMTVTEDGSLIMITSTWSDSGDQSYYLITIDASGNETGRVDITAVLMDGNDPEWGVNPQAMEVDAEGNIYVLLSAMNESVLIFNAQGQKICNLTSDGWFQGMGKTPDGRVLVMRYDYSSENGEYIFQHADPKTKQFGDTYKGLPSANGNVYFAPAEEGKMLISSGNTVYNYNLETQTSEELFNWIDCDINTDNLYKLTYTNDGRILAFLYNWEAENGRSEAVYLTKTPASEVTQKTVLTYATLSLDYEIKSEIIQFNKTNDTYRIEVKEYGYDGQDLMNSDILSGNTPDLIDLNNVNTSALISKGVLTDLYTMMEQDSTVKKEDFVASALKCYEQDGKLYGIPISFYIRTLMGRTSDVGTEMGWTIQDVQQLMASKPEGTELIEYASRESILQIFTMLGIDSYIDWSTGTCSFESEDFIQLLEFANTFPAMDDLDYENREGTYTKLSQGKLLLADCFMDEINGYLSMADMFGEPVTCIGYPTPTGSGSIISANMSIGIAEKSEYKEAAWDFVSTLLGEEYQSGLAWNFPVLQSALEADFADAMEEKENGSGWGWDDFTWEERPATAEEVEAVRAVIEQAEPVPSYDDEIMSMIVEEASPFFAGQKTAAEVAKIIQSRVSVYVSENS